MVAGPYALILCCAGQSPDTEAAHLLQKLNVRPRQVAELADMPLHLVRAAIADGQARPYVRDLAGWVVAMLRDARDEGWGIAPPAAPAADVRAAALRASFARLRAEMLGYSVAEMLQQPVAAFLDARARHEALQLVCQAHAHSAQHDFRFRRKDGSAFWGLISTSSVRDGAGHITGTLSMITDITERKRAEAALRESEELHRLIAEHTHDLISLLDKVSTALRTPVCSQSRTLRALTPSSCAASAVLISVVPGQSAKRPIRRGQWAPGSGSRVCSYNHRH